MGTSDITVTSVRLETLSPHHYQSLAIPSGVSSLATYMADRSVAYGLAGAFGCLSPGVALPQRNYRRDFARMTWLASVFEAEQPGLMRPQGRRLNLDQEGGYQNSIQLATGTGNLKSWFFIQEIPPNVIYNGALFGPDPFEIASEVERTEIGHVVFRVGRHRGGLVRMERTVSRDVRLNLHTGFTCGADVNRDDRLRAELPALWDLQISSLLSPATAVGIIADWRARARAETKET